LRFAGVPTRYVTGFIVTERDPLEDVWIVRQAHAHAWVEAWDQEQGLWRTVEATVQEELDAARTEAPLDALTNGDIAFYRRLMQSLYQYGIIGVLVWLYEYYSLYMQFLFSLIIALLCVLAVRRFKRRHAGVGPLRCRVPLDHPYGMTLHKMRRRLDRKLKRLGLERDPTETLSCFAQRLQTAPAESGPAASAARWYHLYNRIRYRKVVTPADLKALRHELDTVL